MAVTSATVDTLTHQMATLNLRPFVLPLELVGKIASYITSNRETIFFLLKLHPGIRNHFSNVLAKVDGRKLSALVSQLVNFATEVQWNAFLARLEPSTSFANIPLQLTLMRNQPTVVPRLQQLQKRFSPLAGLCIRGIDFDVATVIPLCPQLQSLELKDYMKMTDRDFHNLTLPSTLTRFCMQLYSLRSGVIAEVGASVFTHLFQQCPNLCHVEFRDNPETIEPRHSLAAVKWPTKLQSLALPDWLFSKEELCALLRTARSLTELKVHHFQEEITSAECIQLDLPCRFKRIVLTHDEKMETLRKGFAKDMALVQHALGKCPHFQLALEQQAHAHYRKGEKEHARKIVAELAGSLQFLLPLVKDYFRTNQPYALQIAKDVVQYGHDTVSFKAYAGDLLHRGTDCAHDPVGAKDLLEQALRADSKEIDRDAYQLSRLSLAALLQKGAADVVVDPVRAKSLRDPKNWN